MNAAYVGILTDGSTSRMRAKCLRELRPEWNWEWLDTDEPMTESARLWQSLAYRFQAGPAVRRLNEAVNDWVSGKSLDLLWVDKAIFLYPQTMRRLRKAARRLVHFTPDTAFHANRSRYFNRTMELFDLLVTTKSFEVDEYRRRVRRDKILLTTQGYDANVHYSRNGDEIRRREAIFIGLAEPDRERCIETLLERGIPVRIGGRGWDSFMRKWQSSSLLQFAGTDVFGTQYAQLLSESWVGLGLLSKRFPELHTTRTFEIPACGTILATERTAETETFYSSNEAIFFDNFAELAEHVSSVLDYPIDRLSRIADAGRNRVRSDHRSYVSILSAILNDSRVTL